MRIPSTEDLLESYEGLQKPHTFFSEEEIVTLTTWTRFDPRLMEQAIIYASKKWSDWNPVRLRNLAIENKTEQAFAVLLEHVSILLKSPIFENWKKLICHDLQPVPYQRYFIGLDKPASPRALRSAAQAIEIFKKWGFLESELIINKIQNYPKGSYSVETRELILKDLLLSKPRVSRADYLMVLNQSLSPRQALRDLENCPFVKAEGTGKGRRYSLKRAKSTS